MAAINKESLVHCGLSTAAAAVHERLFFSLVYCGTSCTAAAAVGIDAPQFESFYMVPFKYTAERIKFLVFV